MSDAIRHECGIAYIRLRKPLGFYQEKYGSALFAINKLYLLMEKQHNRGQDGAGIASLKLNIEKGYPQLSRLRSNKKQPIADIFAQVNTELEELEKQYPSIRQQPEMLKGFMKNFGEVYIGHLRYGTQGRNDISYCHPFLKSSIEPVQNLCMAGNFNIVNTKELFSYLKNINKDEINTDSDLAAMLEIVHHYLKENFASNDSQIDWKNILSLSTNLFDGAFAVAGMCGNGDSFVFRDKHGIRPMYYFMNDEIVVAASERPALQTAFNVYKEEIKEVLPGQAIIVKADGEVLFEKIMPEAEKKACSFERIYFSRGSDEDIYNERKQLGRFLSKKVLRAIGYDLKNTIFSFIPNTAETAFFGLIKGAEAYLNEIKVKRITDWNKDFDEEKLSEMINRRVRIEKIAIKDVKMRTFITQDHARDEMVQHVYDITYGTVRNGIDTLVVIDDSIVRGTTLRESIIRMLDRLGPKKIIIVSSAPQIRYPDCYGIDMSKMGSFIAFQAAVKLLNEQGKKQLLLDVYATCLQAQKSNKLNTENFVKKIYKEFTPDEISNKIAQMLKMEDVNAEVEVIYQTIEDLHLACPENKGDWYFTGDYPTTGGNLVVNKAFMNYIEGNNARGY